MKKRLLSILALTLLVTAVFAQVPQGINYQTVVRNNAGAVINNQNVHFKLSIISGSPTGSIIYSETHNTTTNSLGLVNLIIGQGTPINGTFSTINWGSASHYLSVELDPSGGTAFQAMGISQLMSVPYALSSGSSAASMAQLTDVNVSGVTDGQILKWNVSQLKWLPGNDNGGGSGDNWGTQTVQTNNTLTGNGTSGSPLGVNGILTDNQTLSISGTDLSISGGNTVTLPSSGGAAIPTGAIIMWSGTIANIPSGWALCNGSSGTPDLRDRFILSVSTSENPGATGGTSSYNLTTAQMPSHTHTFTTNSAGAHTHTYSRSSPSINIAMSVGTNPFYDDWSNTQTSSSGAHTHSGTTDATGSGASIDNRPAFYKLAFIMKL